jgi:catalase
MSGDALHFLNEAFKHCKPVAASSEGVDLLMATEIVGVELAQAATQGQVVSDKGVITVRHADDLGAFIEQFTMAIKQHRHWEREMKDQVPA